MNILCCTPYRLVLHEGREANLSHLDLFLLAYGKDFLYSYEISIAFMQNFTEKQRERSISAHAEIPLWASLLNRRGEKKEEKTAKVFISLTPITEEGQSQKEGREGTPFWGALPKASHRLHYWSYSGPISNRRGSIRSLGYGKLFSEGPSISFLAPRL